MNGVIGKAIMIKVLIADDHAVVLEGLKQILLETPDIVVSAQARDGQEVLEKLRSNQVDVVVLDNCDARTKRVGYADADQAGTAQSTRSCAQHAS
jgi:DNA-binding NarL/FixJ family response regulator